MSKPSPTSIRLPDDLREWLDAKAKAERRNMTAQLLRILEQAKQAEPDYDFAKDPEYQDEDEGAA